MDDLVSELADIQQRSKYLSNLVEKRVANVDYVKRLYEYQSKNHWLNIVHVDPIELYSGLDETTKRRRNQLWFSLGVNLAPLIHLENTATYIRSLAQMLEEFEYFKDNIDSLKYLAGFKSSVSVNLDKEFDVIKPKLHKAGNVVAFEFLQIFNIPGELDYFQIIYSLCDVLKMVYTKFVDEVCSNKVFFEAIKSIDKTLKKLFYDVLAKEMNKSAKKTIEKQLGDYENFLRAWKF